MSGVRRWRGNRRLRSGMVLFFFFNDTATTEIYTLSLHDALPIFYDLVNPATGEAFAQAPMSSKADVDKAFEVAEKALDRKSTRLNSSHANISYAVFCLKKKKCNIFMYYLFMHTSHNLSPDSSHFR